MLEQNGSSMELCKVSMGSLIQKQEHGHVFLII